MNKLKRIILIVSSVLIAGTTSLPLVSAQERGAEERITLSPAVSRPVLNAGERANGKLTVINDGTIGYTFLLYSRPFSVNGEDYNPNYTTINERTEAHQWVQFSQTKVRLEPGSRIDVPYTVQTPSNARGGGHYAVLFAETQPPDNQPTSVARKKRVGSLLYMRVNGDVIEKGEIESWTANTIQTKPPLVSTLKLKNTGNIHYQADLKATYTNIFGKKQFELNQQLLIMPGTTRKVTVAWEKTPYIGIFKAAGQVTYLGKTEQLASKYVVLLPYSFMLGILAVVVLYILWVIMKKLKNKPKNRKFKA